MRSKDIVDRFRSDEHDVAMRGNELADQTIEQMWPFMWLQRSFALESFSVG
jgi:hypothetical protein